jgi:hypothetical protein
MRFICLIYHDDRDRDAMPPAAWRSHMDDGIARFQELRAEGIALDGAALQPAHTGMTMRMRNGKPSYTDGPFMETKEQLAGYILLEAPDVQAAAEIAATLPPGRFGAIEVRPLWEGDDIMERRTT